MSVREEILNNARADMGYAEGLNNANKYGEWYGLPNQPWCAMAVCKWIYDAKVTEDIVPKFASCTKGFQTFSKMGITKDKNYVPQEGDLIFLDWEPEKGDGVDHVGLVEYVEENTIHTIEGNHNDKVDKWTYPIGSKNIWGYACPNYDNIENNADTENLYTLIAKGSKGNLVKIAQQNLIEKGYTLPKYGVDGNFGAETEEQVKQFQADMQIIIDGKIGENTWKKLTDATTKKPIFSYPGYLIIKGQKTEEVTKVQQKLEEKGYHLSKYGIDGNFGTETEDAIKKFQKENQLVTDGIIGPLTWRKLFV